MLKTHELTALLLACFAAFACETTKFLPAQELPSQFLEVFEPCFPRSGTYELESKGVFGAGLTPAVQLAFEAPLKEQTALEVSAGIGPSLLAIKADGQSLQKGGVFAHLIEPISIGDQGKLLYKGYYAGLQVGELGCILAGKIPADWIHKVKSVSNLGKQKTLHVKHGKRDIKIVLDQLANPAERSFCSTLTWRVAAGLFKPNVQWCYGKPGSRFSPKNHHSVLRYEKKAIFWSPI